MKDLAIVTVNYNSKDLLAKTLGGILPLMPESWEYILIDGGSVDESRETFERYRDIVSFAISEKDDGIYDAMNKGVRNCNSRFIYFLNAGDIVNVDALIKLVEVSKSEERSGIIFGDVFLSSLGKLKIQDFSRLSLIRNRICHQSMILRKEAYLEFGGFDTKYKICADHVLNLKISGSRAYELVYVPITICSYLGGGASEHFNDEVYEMNRSRLILKHFGIIEYIYFRLGKAIKNKILDRVNILS